jgi:nondiscriminating aspartyl-tRNA synthetase
VSSKIVASGTEGGTNLFEIKYFDRVAYLAQSPQFYKQHGVVGFERVFETGHVYRAEPYATSRHLTEYYSLDFEMGFIDGPEDVIQVERFSARQN